MLPAPWVARRVDPLAGSGGEVSVDSGRVGGIGVVTQAFPAAVRIGALLVGAVALNDQSGLIEADLRDRLPFDEVPHFGGQRIVALP